MFSHYYARKRIIRRILYVAAAVMLAVGAAFAAGSGTETEEKPFATFDSVNWSFCSGVGGWSTDMRLLPDGSFTGDFHDGEMGETGEDYPMGTVYYCTFYGRLSPVARVDENTWKVKVDFVKLKETPDTATIEDGIRYVTVDSVYGLAEGDEMLLYAPGTSLDVFTDSMKMWAHVFDLQDKPVTMQDWFLYSPANDTGFVGYIPTPEADDVSLGIPWENLTADQLKALTGLPLNLPEGAEQAAYRWYRSDSIAEMEFTWKGGSYCFRAKNQIPDENGLQDISGLYFDWKNQEDITLAGHPGTICVAQSGTGNWVECCYWYNLDSQTLYTFSVIAPDVNGLDLTVIAENIITAK